MTRNNASPSPRPLRRRGTLGLLALLSISCALAAPLGHAAWATTVYVAPSGADSNPGTKAKPFATLERARDALRAVPKGHARKVILRGGVYRITKTLQLGPKDSGTVRRPAVWKAARGETVRLIGGPRLTDWGPVTDKSIRARLNPEARKHVLQCDLKALGITRLGTVQPQGYNRTELFFNHKYMTLARYPNKGWLTIAGLPSNPQFKVPDKDNPKVVRYKGPFEYSGNRPERWRSAKDIWMHGYWTFDWADDYERVARFDYAKHLVWPKRPYHHYGYTKGHRYYFLNILEELDRPGEWYLDRHSRILYFWPPEPIQSAEVRFPDLEKPMLVLDDASHVALRRITFECSRAGAIVIKGGADDRVQGCVVRNVGGAAIDIQSGTHHLVQSCDIYDVAGTGVNVHGGDRATLTPADDVVSNCDIHDYAQVLRTYHPAVSLNGVGNRVAHCFIHDAPHQGVEYTGNDHVIEYCEFTRVAYETGDVGAIYTDMDWTYMGEVFRYNYFHHIHGPGKLGCFTIYPDLPCGGIHLYGNVFYDVDQGFLTNSGRGMTIENNLFLRCARTFRFNVWGRLSMFRLGGAWHMVERLHRVHYDQPPYSVRYPALVGLARDFALGERGIVQRTLPKDNIIRRNISAGPHFLNLGAQASLADVKVERNLICNSMILTGSPTGDGHTETYSHDNATIRRILAKSGNILRFNDPGIVNPTTEDFRLRRDSPARKLGFKRIPFRKIGLYVDRYRTRLPLRAPLVSPEPTLFVGKLAVRLVPCRRGARAVIRYTLDGTDPTPDSPIYRSRIRLHDTTTVKAAAFARGMRSKVVSTTYTSARLGSAHGVYLSDLKAMDYTGPDGLGSPGLLKDCGEHGKPLRLGEHTYRKGLSLQPVETPNGVIARVTYALTGGLAAARRFHAEVGVADQTSPDRICRFIVEFHRAGTWHKAFDSGPLTSRTSPRAVDVSVAGADLLRLKATGKGLRAVWADAKLE